MHESEFDWSAFTAWLNENAWLYANIAALMAWLEQTKIIAIPPQMREVLGGVDRAIEPWTMKYLMWLMYKYPFNAFERDYDGYARMRAHSIWKELTRPESRDITIPLSLFRTMIRSIHHGRYNPLHWALSLFKTLRFGSSRD